MIDRTGKVTAPKNNRLVRTIQWHSVNLVVINRDLELRKAIVCGDGAEKYPLDAGAMSSYLNTPLSVGGAISNWHVP